MAYKINKNHGQRMCSYFSKIDLFSSYITFQKISHVIHKVITKIICIDLVMPKLPIYIKVRNFNANMDMRFGNYFNVDF